jgi:hypothetical protein
MQGVGSLVRLSVIADFSITGMVLRRAPRSLALTVPILVPADWFPDMLVSP